MNRWKIILIGIFGIVVFLPLLIGLFYSPDLILPDGMMREKLEMKGGAIRFYQKGEENDILLIHVGMGSIEDWEMLFLLIFDGLHKRI